MASSDVRYILVFVVPAAVCGAVYVYAREQYFTGYAEDAKKRQVTAYKLHLHLPRYIIRQTSDTAQPNQ